MSEFYKISAAESLAELNTDAATGLSDAEITRRQAEFGKNSLPAGEGTNWVKLIVGQFTDLMVIILIVAAVISALLGDTKDVIVILAIVILNAILGIYQEYQAEQALAALSAMQVPLVRARRKGEVRQISAEDLVPGDIVVLGEGDRIPADGRLIESINLQIDESALTGESVPVDKNIKPIDSDQAVAVGDRSNMAFMGTAVNFGRGEMLITRTGLKTELGNIAAMLLQVEEGITPLQRRLNDLGKMLAAGAGLVVFMVFIAGVIRGIPIEDMFLTAISLAVAAVPEGLPALITVSLSLGAARMVRRHALIRRLPAVETLGSVTVICSDKTGTLTKNEMTVTKISMPGHADIIVTGSGYSVEGKFKAADSLKTIEVPIITENTSLPIHNFEPFQRLIGAIALSNNAILQGNEDTDDLIILGDTTEGALLVAAQKGGITREELQKALPRVGELPFSSDRKAMTTIHKVDSNEAHLLLPNTPYIAITKGAPDQLLDWATHELLPDGPAEINAERSKEWQTVINQMAQEGLRVLGIAYRPLEEIPDSITPEIERGLYLLGLIGIQDPARPEAKEAVRVAREAGIRPVMITGDHALTAESIARDLGILRPGEKAITGAQLDTMNDDQLKDALKRTSAFARVSPEHKLRLVRVLQSQNEIVAMTGDGVNDAPALKQADIGVAMGITGTDVSKGAAEMVLTDDNFASIVAAVEEGRVIYDNIRKFVKYLLSSNVGEILVMFIAIVAGLKIPLLAIQILWINLVTDGLPAIAMGFEPAEDGVMKRKPRPTSESIFAGGMGRHIIWVSILLTILTLGTYIYGYAAHSMNPLSPSLGIEQMNTQRLERLLGADAMARLVPQNWDTLTEDERVSILMAHENDEATEEETSGGIIGAAERAPRTMAFVVLALAQIFHVMAIHAGDKVSFFKTWFSKNQLLLLAVISTFLLQLSVIYIPFLQHTFETIPLTLGELVITIVIASMVLFAVELEKYMQRREQPKTTV
ncbi:MAG: cation-translocating P-type ATPase [Anaerolineae bacterium]|nr:cation-translocating P-type ATPase [Anaerolineae bacterium]